MALPSIKFKKALLRMDQASREITLYRLKEWLIQQVNYDPNASQCHQWIQTLHAENAHMTNSSFKQSYTWDLMTNHDKCISFQEIVKAKLGVPCTNVKELVAHPEKGERKPIPKKLRGEVWKMHFGTSTEGGCYCCKKGLSAFDDWHAGHILARSRGGTDTIDNLRPVCGSCNLSMGSESMDEFKQRCYPKV